MLVLGGLIIIASYTIAPLAGWIDELLGCGSYKRLEWATNDTLQLQRLAHEELGCGTWVGEEFPTTTNTGEKLAVLDISDPRHPKLVNPAMMDDALSQKSSNPSADDTSDPHNLTLVNPAMIDNAIPSADADSTN